MRDPSPTARLTSNDKVSNGRLMPKSVDMRSVAGRRFRHLVQGLEAELTGCASETAKTLIRQIAAVQLQTELLQAKIVKGEPIDTDMMVRLSGEHRRLMSIYRGLASQNKPGRPTTLSEIMAELDAE
jgi:hypothetical protein